MIVARYREVNRLDGRIDALEVRLGQIDQGGTRGVAVLTARVDELVKDAADLKSDIKTLSTNVETEIRLVKSGRWQIASAVFLALIPVYAGVVFAIVTH